MMLISLQILILLHAAAQGEEEFNFFHFVRQWTPNLCFNSTHKCTHLVPQMKKHWTIHGLWPSFDADRYPSDCAGTKCQFNITAISDLRERLHGVWPTDYSMTDETFWSHEYCKHGTCCTDVLPTEHEFFNKTLALHGQYNIENALSMHGIVPHRNRQYHLEHIRAALDTKIGSGHAEIWCRFVKDRGVRKQVFFQIAICIDRQFGAMDCPVGKRKLCHNTDPVYYLPYSAVDPGSEEF